MIPAIDSKIRRRFDASAGRYDRYTTLHRQIAERLLSRVTKMPAPKICLDVGCGTGYLTRRLKDSFPQSEITGLDFAQGMLEAARVQNPGIAWILADSRRLPFSDGHFDALVSNLAYQWAADLPQAFGEARRVLASGGILACTLFGFQTCRELFESLDQAKAGQLQFARLPDTNQVREALTLGGFREPGVDREEIKITFKGMHELMLWLKAVGANNLLQEGYLGPEALLRAAAIYKEKFSNQQGVESTFEVIWVHAQK
ncbi:MAG: methyltransferase domain-containing protein [Candidatus Omnitrophica bacterium]|nr:methyltransferase domain-containing protein [Candidatus Omnitrophota bacterium]